MFQQKCNRRDCLKTLTLSASAMAIPPIIQAAAGSRKPNIVLIFTDDQGYADLGLYGARGFTTPHLDQMGREGIRFTDFHVAQPVCGASRAALLTGCYPNRIGMLGAPSHNSNHGISDGEMTIAEMLKQHDYAAAIFGKWHLGHHPPFLPTRHGFDEYFGLPYSNDMWPFHPENPGGYPPLPLIEGETVIQENPDQAKLTTWYTERAVDFIERNQDKPFFLYVAHSMPHVPLFVSRKFKGKSEQGMYGDVIMEIDWSVGQILAAVKQCGLDNDTLVIFTSDNGPWLSYGDHAGCALPLREGKGTTWDGGQRVPCIMRWPGKIPAGAVCDEPAMTIDILPTLAELADCRLPDHVIDGKSIWPLMAGAPNAETLHDALYFYWNDNLEAVRSGRWKLHFPHKYRTLAGKPGGVGGVPAKYEQAETGIALYDMKTDIGEQTNLAERYPDIVNCLAERGKRFDEQLKQTKRQAGKIHP
ncbi:MAG: arylsulfatase [Candidatus Omnitrophota bacterium]|jgi:arylsulfatase A-like enzyme|nr:MAG: arylsulfatase [Candidatus Omnitrophota bacterium]